MPPKVAFVYDRVNTLYGGAEKVLLALHQAFPQAPLFTSVYHPRANWAQVFQIETSFLQKIPFANQLHRFFVPLMPLAFEAFDLSRYEIIISITSAEAKGIITKPNQLHLCYMLTPTRYLYSHRQQYEQTHWPFKIPVMNFFSRKIFDYLTWWDQTAASRPDVIVPISHLVTKRVTKYYQRSCAKVLYPPVNLAELGPSSNSLAYQPSYLPKEYYLVIARLVPYKRIELAIQACQKLHKNLVIIGEGPQEKELRKLANQNTSFLGSVTHPQRQAILNQATALLMPGIEDFGIIALEAVLSHKPVILHQHSGVSELLKNEPVAVFLDKLTQKNLEQALLQLEKTQFKFTATKKKLQKYAINDFTKRFKTTVFEFYNKKIGEINL